MNDTQAFGSWVKQRRKALDMTQIELANLVGCSESAIIKIELGQRRPSRQVAERLLESLEIVPDEQQAFRSLARAASGAGAPGTGAAPSFALFPARVPVPTQPPPNNVPARITSLVGREGEIKRVTEHLLGDA